MSYSKRSEIKKGTELNLKFFDVEGNTVTRRVVIEEQVGSGASCVCYAVKVQWDKNIKKSMILKIFYPDPAMMECRIELDENLELSVSDASVIVSLANGFERANVLQNDLSNNLERTSSMIVRPVESRMSGLTKYVLYDNDYSYSLKIQEQIWKQMPCETIEQQKHLLHDQLCAIYQTAKALYALHQENILHMDLKPDNILWIDNNKVKFFDFDASISMDHSSIQKLDKLRGDADIRLTAPELLRGDGDYFRQYKWLYLRPAVDIYSLGCILFRYLFDRLPEKKDVSDMEYAWEWMGTKLKDKYRSILTEDVQNMIKYIAVSSITDSLEDRYQSADIMAADLKKVIEELEKEEMETAEEKADYAMLAAIALDEHPLCDYPSEDIAGNPALDAVFIGTSPMREAFFEHIFSSAQMPASTLNLYFISSDADVYRKHLLKSCPALEKTTSIATENGTSLRLDANITKEPLAYLHFYSTEQTEKVLQQLTRNKRTAPHYYLVADRLANAQDTSNRMLAIQLTQIFAGTPEPVYIGFGDQRGDGYTVRPLRADELPKDMGQLKTGVFPLTASHLSNEQEMEKQFQKSVMQRAFSIHCYYEYKTGKGITEKQMRENFESADKNYYNKRSSIRAALSWPYKLAACGIDRKESTSEQQYKHLILSEIPDESLRGQQLFLEHRSWLCFVILDGWRRPTAEQAEQYTFVNENTHQDKIHKLHPCMCDSTAEQRITSTLGRNEQLWYFAWNDPEQRNSYDLLDQMSLQFHDLSRRKAEQVQISVYLNALCPELAYAGENMDEEVNALKRAMESIRRGEAEGNGLWGEAVDRIRTQTQAKNVQALMDILERNMRPWLEWNSFRDYKLSDESILQALVRK